MEGALRLPNAWAALQSQSAGRQPVQKCAPVFGNTRAHPEQSEVNMSGDYVFLCGVMWCKYGQQDAGSELMRAAQCEDPDVSALALAMLREGASTFYVFHE